MSGIEHGRCGDRGAELLGTDRPHPACALTWGHGGWHRGDDGSEWTHGDDEAGSFKVADLQPFLDALDRLRAEVMAIYDGHRGRSTFQTGAKDE